MCGLFGVITDDTYKEVKNKQAFLAQASITGVLRGFDSTGMMMLSKNKDKPTVFKRALAGYDFIQLRKAGKLLDKLNQFNVVAFHNRAATKGVVEDNTAHPFQVGHITLMHNGTLTNHYQLPIKDNFAVDSEALTHYLSKEDSIQEVVNNVRGAYTLLWHNSRDNTFNFLSNGERPFYIASVKDSTTKLFASEEGMLEWLAVRNGFKVEAIESAPTFTHLSWSLDDVTKSKARKLVEPAKASYNNNAVNYNSRYNNTSTVGRKDRINKMLTQAGAKVKVGDKLEFASFQYVPYNKNSHVGAVWGYMLEDPFLEVQACNATARMEEHAENFENMGGLVCGAYMNREGRLIIRVDNIVVLECEEEEKKPEGPALAGPRGTLLTRKEWDMATKNGCCNCGCNIEPAEQDIISWTMDNQPVCTECQDTLAMSGFMLH